MDIIINKVSVDIILSFYLIYILQIHILTLISFHSQMYSFKLAFEKYRLVFWNLSIAS